MVAEGLASERLFKEQSQRILFKKKLLCQFISPSVRPIRVRAYKMNAPGKRTNLARNRE